MIDIVIVNWNSGFQLREAVESITEFHNSLVNSIIIIDNASPDKSCVLKKSDPKIKIIKNLMNLGFATACNQGAAICSAEYLLFLNPDTRLFKNSLSVPHTFMSDPKNASTGICGIQLIDELGKVDRSCARFPTAKMFVMQSLGLTKLPWLKKFGQRMTEWDHLETRHVDQVMGAFFLVRRSLYDMLNGFDERFFVYFEEVDFSKRASSLGWHSIYLSEAQAFHAGGGTSRQVKTHRLFYYLRSRILYGFKHFSSSRAWILVLFTLVVEPLSRVFLAGCKRDWSEIKNILIAFFILISDLPFILRAAFQKQL